MQPFILCNVDCETIGARIALKIEILLSVSWLEMHFCKKNTIEGGLHEDILNLLFNRF